MKIVIFSDTHLTSKFDERKFKYLCRIIRSADKVLINGDFWDSWFTDFDSFVNSPWSKLFPLLRSKDTVYIFGNHDPKNLCDARTSLFSVENKNFFEISCANNLYHIEHGHKLLESRESFFLRPYYSFLAYINSRKIRIFFYAILRFFEYLGWKIGGSFLMMNRYIGGRKNDIQRRYGPENRFLICADTHKCALDLSKQYANSGLINFGYASYISIIAGKISLHTEKY